MTTTTKWDGNSMTQKDMMLKDTVIVLSENDEVIGSASKKEAHIFDMKQPTGILHRAFSVFLFDESTNELLLQQRASTKITFPNVWTNTCCSHPLHGMEPEEVDTADSVADGSVMGVKHAAIRKLEHELGIPPSQLDVTKFKFLTRFHYWAADTVTHGPKSPWGEHEIDYVLFYTIDNKSAITMKPHPDEVDDVKWVTQEDLQEMFQDKSLLLSPWFRLIVQRWALGSNGWWCNLKETMNTDKYCDFNNIARFDPPKEHFGGGGNAGPKFLEGDSTKKQGAYGKIKTHKESKLSQLCQLDEVWSAVTLLYLKPLVSNLETDYIKKTFSSEELIFCDEILGKVSRSFAAVIRQLPQQLLVDVLVFYLVLRALDTVEDDTTAFPDIAVKVTLLQKFHEQALVDPNWTLDNVGEGDERRLLQEFSKCQTTYSELKSESRSVIADITKRMGMGMAEFVEKDMGQGTATVEEYNRYCHFVAGLVGEGLSRLFVVSGLESVSLKKELQLSDQMGMFLQKVNIIRDYLEDYVDGRAWWPKSIWSKYSETDDLGYFCNMTDDKVRTNSLACLNELVTDALELAPDCLAYMSMLQCAEIFRFCAIPQVMAIATLDKLYNNPDVFTGVVKIRKGLSCKLILQANNISELHSIFHDFSKSISSKAKKCAKNDPSLKRTIKACQVVIDKTETTRTRKNNSVKKLAVGLIATLAVKNSISSKEWIVPLDYLARGMALGITTLLFWNSTFPKKNQLKSAGVLGKKI
mmetsp:Transcript_8618/g.9878  ORF Transcript_8618/g.9878 Transcript_8618/m.9878 type:complete len:752 (+) Transcript_8618:87-2342(+)|eukprot:CAMPEP_0194146290 /NCGR_PEP_ID=MMETSP0152-20130528/20502_1 /TAXON_ID=1049557 /ORGANISM="Thalassiothrix antarctica, Strain L6-D1" /LENGTH=751 /DNA_ID=CAMNT_0038846775 /DNA_START=49 /DNA_END=2304 /DNA_ORIENTATION=+